MFSSLASFLFGSNANCETTSETTATDTATDLNEQRDTRNNLVDEKNLVQVTSLTPSVTGAGPRGQGAIKRGKTKQNNARQQNKREGIKASLPLKAKQTNIETSSESEELDEDEWFIVGKEDVEKQNVSFNRRDSQEENIPVAITPVAVNNLELPPRRPQNVASQSLYNGTRPVKQRNCLQKTRNNCNNRPGNGLSVSTSSPSRIVDYGHTGTDSDAMDDSDLNRAMHKAPVVSQQTDQKATDSDEPIDKMEESWFITPPPCFTSTGPVDMQTSPYENLLIEHPSMSVYHRIKRAYEYKPSFIEVATGVNDMAEKQQKVNETTPPKKNSQAVQPRTSGPGYRLDRQTMAQLKQELIARNVQKVKAKNENKDISRTAIKRANRVRDVQSRNHTKRRSDRQHNRIFSNANNNRKSNSC